MKVKFHTFLIVITLLCSACGQKAGTPGDTPTSGSINMSVDEALQPIVDAELQVFHAQYPKAHINAQYKTENEAFADVIKDCTRVIIASRDFNEQEKAFFKSKNRNIHKELIAKDALALIANPENPTSQLTYKQLQDIFTGKVKNWAEIAENNKLGEITCSV